MTLKPEHRPATWVYVAGGTAGAVSILAGVKAAVANAAGLGTALLNASIGVAVVASVVLIAIVSVRSLKEFMEQCEERTTRWLSARTDKQAAKHDRTVLAVRDEIMGGVDDVLQAIKELRITELTMYAEQEQSNLRVLPKR